ncbi:MAG: MFS transporter [Variovorax paradoxus]|uniref:MFS transporter n=1 Tax=Variovorax paradoxus TaxID=34073 RepID=A0A2W5Q493_VARPD|nr:MAG: MFS transporter [Variovorax paradoxus]
MPPPARTFGPSQGLRYGLLGLPLAFVALPLYVQLPHHYAASFGVPLAALGAVLLGARLFDAVVDPLLGRLCDGWLSHSSRAVLAGGAAAAAMLAAGFAGLFFPQALVDPARTGVLLVVAGALLTLSYLGYSLLSIAHQSWGALLGGDAAMRSRVVGWREGLGLVGVVLASVLPGLAGLPAMVGFFALALGAGWLAWTRAPRPAAATVAGSVDAAFRRLLGVFVLNGIASAVPATLVLFFVQDRLQAPPAMEPAFLGSYFVCAAASIPLWLRLAPRWGLARTWLGGMGLSVAVFAWTAALGAGDAVPFLAVCVLSGFALGTDLVLPGALLAGQIARAADQPRAGAYFGWWNFATKLNLALAAGLALPLLGAAGYVPGTRDAEGLRALGWAYAVLPCVLKLLAAGALWALVIRPGAASSSSPLADPP